MKLLSFSALLRCAAAASFMMLVADMAWGQTTGALPQDPAGEWLVDKKVARIRIADCGDGHIWGVVSWEQNTGGIDRKNPDPNLRSRPTFGMPILLDMTQKKPNRWDGKIYSSEDGHTYSANISLLNPDTLRVQGCFLGFLCGGENWTRYIEPPAPPNTKKPRAPQATRPGANPNPNQIESADDVCSRALGAAWLPHERRLK
jgi:uncharacterized protein (DUF2147 family)